MNYTKKVNWVKDRERPLCEPWKYLNKKSTLIDLSELCRLFKNKKNIFESKYKILLGNIYFINNSTLEKTMTFQDTSTNQYSILTILTTDYMLIWIIGISRLHVATNKKYFFYFDPWIKWMNNSNLGDSKLSLKKWLY